MLSANRIVLTACMLLPLAGLGCGSRFAGDWVQESVVLRDGTVRSLAGERRMALRFEPPTCVSVGMYSDAAGVVDEGTVMLGDYSTLQDRTVAQFGAYTARVDDGVLVTYIGSNEAGRFRRVNGPSIFPSRVKLPNLSQANPPTTDADAPLATVTLPQPVAGVVRPGVPEFAQSD